jgi:hypothetical protein
MPFSSRFANVRLQFFPPRAVHCNEKVIGR